MPAVTRPIQKHRFKTPRLRFEVRDLSNHGASVFLDNVKAASDIEDQVQNVLNLLYDPSSSRPGTRSVTFVLREFEGVAYTTGTDLDDDHKEIHINTGYVGSRSGDIRHELLGVICHELVHCFQWNAKGTCDGGLIEGVADYVRLNAGLAAAHWQKDGSGSWNGGYQHTGYFLDYLEKRFGAGTIKRLNAALEKDEYNEKKLFSECCGHTVQKLWDDYREALDEESRGTSSAQAFIPVPTHVPRST